jgi:hypothetical protein
MTRGAAPTGPGHGWTRPSSRLSGAQHRPGEATAESQPAPGRACAGGEARLGPNRPNLLLTVISAHVLFFVKKPARLSMTGCGPPGRPARWRSRGATRDRGSGRKGGERTRAPASSPRVCHVTAHRRALRRGLLSAAGLSSSAVATANGTLSRVRSRGRTRCREPCTAAPRTMHAGRETRAASAHRVPCSTSTPQARHSACLHRFIRASPAARCARGRTWNR